jgi:hypothetical protein
MKSKDVRRLGLGGLIYTSPTDQRKIQEVPGERTIPAGEEHRRIPMAGSQPRPEGGYIGLTGVHAATARRPPTLKFRIPIWKAATMSAYE